MSTSICLLSLHNRSPGLDVYEHMTRSETSVKVGTYSDLNLHIGGDGTCLQVVDGVEVESYILMDNLTLERKPHRDSVAKRLTGVFANQKV